MNITEADIYWVLILDNIRDFLHGYGVMAVFSGLLSCITFTLLYYGHNRREFTYRKLIMILLISIFVLISGVLSLCGYTLIPSSKQMATIKVLPAITNNVDLNGVSNEFKDLYVIAKEGLIKEFTAKISDDVAKKE